MNPKKKDKLVTLSFQIPPSTKDGLIELAAENERSVSFTVRKMIEERIAIQKEAKAKRDKAPSDPVRLKKPDTNQQSHEGVA